MNIDRVPVVSWSKKPGGAWDERQEAELAVYREGSWEEKAVGRLLGHHGSGGPNASGGHRGSMHVPRVPFTSLSLPIMHLKDPK